MPKLWIGNKMYSVDSEVRDYCGKLEVRIENLEAAIDKCINAMKGSDCLEEKWLIEALKG